MGAARTRRSFEIFRRALELEPERRLQHLDEACAGDAELRAEVEELLAASERAEEFLEQPPSIEDDAAWGVERLAGERLGRYLLRRLVSSGGMGAVYEATQEDPRRTVAVKVMRPGLASRSALRRFEHESQILGRLRHPGIAQIFEACVRVGDGAIDAVPYFAMEFVPDARDIMEFARAKGLDVRGRVELFAQVCDAVHHGHLKGIIHRDLKPANILVDPGGQVKVIDFGVARATDSDLALTTMETEIGSLVGTLQYMSPEQCQGDPHELDIRSDVYALGVVLYELLCSKLPYDLHGLPAIEAARRVREERPARPSTELRALRGDLETIVLRALEKERERRYASAGELRRDLMRYLEGRPITARPPSALYHLRTFARRNKALVGGVVGVIVALAAGLVASASFWRTAVQARDVAVTSLANFNCLSLVLKLEDAESALREVYAVAADDAPAFEAWLEEHWEPIEQGWPDLRATLARLGDGRLEGADLFLRDTLAELEARLTEFGAGPRSAVAHVHEDLAWARTVAERTVLAHADEWRAATRAIAASPLYAGLELPAQIGLIPLGADPVSGLSEFYHLRSAAPGSPIPARDPRTGRIAMTADTGIVLVLLPGGRTILGAQALDPEGPNYDPGILHEELPPRSVVIDPFLLSKFELTQAQWMRLGGEENPSEYPVGERPHGGPAITGANPVERLEFGPLERQLALRHRFDVPLDDQWEYAARAGTTTPWYTGASPESLSGYENLADPTAVERVPVWGGDDALDADGHVVHAPVGSFDANPFGLHDMLGNVQEQCRTWGRGDWTAIRRGGTFAYGSALARCSYRRTTGPHHGMGFRPAWDIRPGLITESLGFRLLGLTAKALHCFDADGDGHPDLFRSRYEPGLDEDRPWRNDLLLNDGAGKFRIAEGARIPPFESVPRGVASADVDGDGDLDLACTFGGDWTEVQNRLFLNDGRAFFSEATASHLPALSDSSYGVALADIDRDGDADLLVANCGPVEAQRNRVYLNDGLGRFRDASDTHLPAAAPGEGEDWSHAIALGDVDGDGDLDLFFGNMHPRCQNRLYLNDGEGRFTDATRGALPPPHVDRGGVGDITLTAAFGDVDGDGDLDLVCGNGWGARWQRNRLYVNDGAGRFVDASAGRLPEDQDRTDVVALADFDGDGDLDLICGNGARSRLYQNDGAGRFRDVTATHLARFGELPGPLGLVVADIDLDGDVDLISGSEEGRRLGLYANNSR